MMDSKKQAEYIGRYVAIIHGIIVTFLAYIGIFMLCNIEGSNILTDYECLSNPKNFHQFSALITVGYLIYDFFVCLILMRDYSSLQM